MTLPSSYIRKIHLQRSRVTGPCDQCGKRCTGPTHYRIRTRYARKEGVVEYADHACTEACADLLVKARCVEIALVCDEPVRVLKEYAA